jgi:putative transposase
VKFDLAYVLLTIDPDCFRSRFYHSKNKVDNFRKAPLGLARSSYYYQTATESPENLRLMRLIDEQYTKRPFYGVEKMTGWLREDKGELINPKRVRRLMRLMGIEAIYPKPRLSQGHAEHRSYPYLLRDVKIERPNQVWSIDITYIRLLGGFVYLVAIIGWYSRDFGILKWPISAP